MENLKKILIMIGCYVVACIISFGVCYLLWAFMHADFDFWEWGGLSRFTMVFVSVVCSVLSVAGLVWFFNEYDDVLDNFVEIKHDTRHSEYDED